LSRAELLDTLDRVLRRVSAQSVLISDTVATHAGLNSTDLECLDLLFLAGPTTAGQLAAHAGLTTGAMTAVIDRLERAKFVRRVHDLRDRRRVLVEVLPRALERIQPLYDPLAAAMVRLHRSYSARDLAVIVDYLSRAAGISAEHVAWLSAQPVAGPKGTSRRRKSRPRKSRSQASGPRTQT
jgi:DNA-binding MarR family transcriptional regulator